ncbi:MAG TPA: hypothetical protein VFQ51_10580 [Vicinamibacteria bacterium]|nr:hypothetical protein [Vicinamibacteria bacterium]
MSHLHEDELTLHYYREDGGVAAAHLAECASCAAAYAALKADLDAIRPADAPERADGFEQAMWRRVEARLPRTRPRWTPWLGGLAIAASLVLAFWLGRRSNVSAPAAQAPMPTQEQVRERVLLVAVGDHLERSQMVLLEVVNAPAGGPADLAAPQHTAEELVSANRLYRQAAVRAGEPAVASVLDDLERVLVEIANSPSPASTTEVDRLRQRIESKGLLLKVRVIGSHVREKEKEVARGTRS